MERVVRVISNNPNALEILSTVLYKLFSCLANLFLLLIKPFKTSTSEGHVGLMLLVLLFIKSRALVTPNWDIKPNTLGIRIDFKLLMVLFNVFCWRELASLGMMFCTKELSN